MTLLPALVISHPETGKQVSAPRGSINSKLPSCASLKSNWSFTSGMREAHEEKMNPNKKK